jgi:Cof subfamily protein (haloacid dehalogenase superfamily)
MITKLEEQMKVLFFDIDGTLVGFDSKLPESTKKALYMAKERGHKIILCTGRSRCQIYPWLLEFGFDGIVGGAGAYVELNGKILSETVLKPQDLKKVISLFELLQTTFMLQTRDHVITSSYCFYEAQRIFREQYGMDEEKIRKVFGNIVIDEKLRERTDVEKLNYYFSIATIPQVSDILGSEFCITATSFEQPEETSGEVSYAGIHKAHGMQLIVEALGMEQKDTIAFGDGPNDLEMLQYAATGVAMGNGVPEAKEVADMITDRIDCDGIYKAMLELKLIGSN